MSEIIHQANQQQFICMMEGKESRLRYRRLDAKTIDAYSTFVPPELRVQGIADQLARAFFNWTQAEGLTIVPSCRYIDVWLRRNANN
ncbi:GNAT family N-acetyltransferase [Aeromonas sobria]|uniref:GNAT family N-acetyltransferase n=1 Tax=Aeromonas sobria TaxID=646 RepID=UPI001118FCB3|nr:GNAT family N-acetyltransferase [Aeromonas sobria]ELM3616368.1 N-acetyltransferase [Aeromonas sobria]TNH92706.1 N-acetyltransferase [Aeromonas sobria]